MNTISKRTLLSLASILVLACNTGPANVGDAQEPSESPSNASRAPVDLVVPSGTLMSVEFNERLSSDESQAGQRFTARVIDPVTVDGRTAIAVGSVVQGKVVEVVPSKRIGGKARLSLDFDSVRVGSRDEVPIEASLHSQAKGQTKKDAATIGGATAGGAILGRIIGHQRDQDADGTAVGAVVGAAIGTAIAASNQGEAATIPAGATVTIRLDTPVRVTVG
jgi:hypothetical protein